MKLEKEDLNKVLCKLKQEIYTVNYKEWDFRDDCKELIKTFLIHWWFSSSLAPFAFFDK